MEKATREQTKTHNTRLVLKTIYQQGEVSRADIARITNLTRTTVSDIVAELIDSGLLIETGMGESAGGKPPILLKVQEDARHLICLDLSANPFSGAVVNLRGRIIQWVSVADMESAPQPPAGPRIDRSCDEGQPLTGQAALEAVYHLLDHLIAQAGASILGIGIGAPGLIDLVKGEIRRSVHLDWSNIPLRQLLEDRYHLPVYLSNDSHAAALAEYTFGEARGSQNLIVVRIGEGIGSGILLSGQIHTGDGYGAGEIGHLTVVEGGRLCSCGNYGCLETVASPQAILQRMRELAEYEWVSFAGKVEPGNINWEFVRQAFYAGDETAVELVKEAGRYLGISIANLVSILNVRQIVISGCYGEFGDIFLQAVSEEVKHRALLTMAAETQIRHSTLGAEIILLGVTALLLSREMGLP